LCDTYSNLRRSGGGLDSVQPRLTSFQTSRREYRVQLAPDADEEKRNPEVG
jgi:hypothetical protein